MPDGPDPWRRFFAWALGSVLALAAIVYAFVFFVDPFDTLFLSPDFNRPPIATNARYSFPALARKSRFDSALFGTSTARLLRPVMLDRLFDAHFANLAMNSARAYEQYRLMQVFARHHPSAKVVMVGIDSVWCEPGSAYEKYTFRQFPEWMYEENRWRPFLEMFNLYTIEQAGLQFGELTGLKPVRYGYDGYANFLPDDGKYDAARVKKTLDNSPPWGSGENDRGQGPFATHSLLREALSSFAPETRKVLFFVPYYLGPDIASGTYPSNLVAACKRAMQGLAADLPNTIVIDFMIGSPITRDPLHYWDSLHTTTAIAERIARDLADASHDVPSAEGDYRILPATKDGGAE